MPDPQRFVAIYPDGRLHGANDSQAVLGAAEEWAAENPGEYVHLYTHAISVRSTPDEQEG